MASSGDKSDSLFSDNASHDRVDLIVTAMCQVTGTWGNTLRFVVLIVAVGMTVRMLTGPIPWERLAALFKLGG